MRILSFLILLAILFLSAEYSDSPHGPGLKFRCDNCHSASGWQFDRINSSFNHNRTDFALSGQHKETDCRQCHPTLVFSDAKTQCFSCHNDIHQSSVGSDCSRCHFPTSWLVNNINEIHQRSRFPLMGIHRVTECGQCHKAENELRFEVNGINCIDCHRQEYLSASNPNHIEAGLEENCEKCHPLNAFEWKGPGFNHNFFPLQKAHSLECSECHHEAAYKGLNPDCISCHQTEFDNTKNPDHQASAFPTNCSQCHSLNPGWTPASFNQHDTKAFPIYSGKHDGEWNTCTDCHDDGTNYSTFSCTNCHEHNKKSMDDKHLGEVRGYSYNSTECYRCHRSGKAD